MFFGPCDLVFQLFKNRPRLFILVQIGQEMAEKSWREKKANRLKNIIVPKF